MCERTLVFSNFTIFQLPKPLFKILKNKINNCLGYLEIKIACMFISYITYTSTLASIYEM